jgi:hypothetical protein
MCDGRWQASQGHRGRAVRLALPRLALGGDRAYFVVRPDGSTRDGSTRCRPLRGWNREMADGLTRRLRRTSALGLIGHSVRTLRRWLRTHPPTGVPSLTPRRRSGARRASTSSSETGEPARRRRTAARRSRPTPERSSCLSAAELPLRQRSKESGVHHRRHPRARRAPKLVCRAGPRGGHGRVRWAARATRSGRGRGN